MQNKLRKLIREVMGHYLPLDDISKRYAKMVMQLLTSNFQEKKKELDERDNLYIREKMSEEDEQISKIRNIDIEIIPSKEKNKNPNHVSGRFIELKQDFVKNKFRYFASFKVYIINWDYQKDLTSDIEKVLSHELFHAFQYIAEINSNNYSNALYNTRNKMKGLDYLSEIEELNDFMEIFYLSLPQEITARIHEAYNQMKNLKLNFKAKSSDEVLQELNKLSVFRDFLKVQRFNLDSVLGLFGVIKKDFVKKFNESLLKYKKEWSANSIRIIDNPDEFFKYWVGRAKRMSLEARHKIVSQAINLFSNKEVVTEFGNNKYQHGYGEQLITEILENIKCSDIIYDYSIGSRYYDNEVGDDFWKEVKQYSKFVI